MSALIPSLLLTALTVLLPGKTPTGQASEEPEALIRKGTAALRAGKIEEALDLAKQAVAIAPREPRVYLLRGSVQAAQRRHTEAIADFDKCLQLDPAFADAWQRRGEEHFKPILTSFSSSGPTRVLATGSAAFPCITRVGSRREPSNSRPGTRCSPTMWRTRSGTTCATHTFWDRSRLAGRS